jgi:hypothetical protein
VGHSTPHRGRAGGQEVGAPGSGRLSWRPMDSRRLSEAELVEIEQRLKRTSAGPWHSEADQVFAREEVLADICCGEIDQAMADATFFAHSRVDVERLLVEVRALQQELARLQRRGA